LLQALVEAFEWRESDAYGIFAKISDLTQDSIIGSNKLASSSNPTSLQARPIASFQPKTSEIQIKRLSICTVQNANSKQT
jgi:hypothetical protein